MSKKQKYSEELVSKEWKPLFCTESYKKSEGPLAVELLESILCALQGTRAGEPIKFAEWQKWVLGQILQLTEQGGYKFQKYLLMVPRKNGKTFLAAMWCFWHLLTAPKYSEIYSVATNQRQASGIFEAMVHWLEATPALKKYLVHEKAKQRIVNIKTKTFMKPLPYDVASMNSIQPYAVVADEIHVWDTRGGYEKAQSFWQTLISGSGSLKKSQILAITTAGANVDSSLLGDLYKHGVRVSTGEIDDPFFGFSCWAADEEEDDPFEYSTWLKANPNLSEGLIQREKLEAEMNSSAAGGIKGFLRYNLNIWARIEGDPFIPRHYWAEAIKEGYRIPHGSKIVAGFDGSKTQDSTCIVIQEIETGHLEVYKLWEKDPNDDRWVVTRQEVIEAWEELGKLYDLQLVWSDASYWEPEVTVWNNSFEWHTQHIATTPAVMIPKAEGFLQDLVEGELSHPSDPVFDRYCYNAIRREGGGFGKASIKMADRIDLLVAAILANGARNFILQQPEEEEVESFIMF